LPPSSFGVGACSVQIRSRGLEFARGERRCSLRPLRSTSLLAHRLFGFERQVPRRASCTPRGFHRGRRRCSPLAHGVAHRLEELRSKRDRRLTSFVASRARITGSSRLTAAFRRATSRCSAGGFTRSARPAYAPSGKGRRFVEPGRPRPYREASRCFRPQSSAMRLVLEDPARSPRTRSPSFHRRPRQSRSFRCRRDDFVPARSHSQEPPCGLLLERDQRCVRSSLCFPLLKQRAPVPCLFPGPASPTLRRAWSRRVTAHRAEDESVSRRSASLWRIALASWGRFLPTHAPGDRTSDTSVATLARYRCARFSRCA